MFICTNMQPYFIGLHILSHTLIGIYPLPPSTPLSWQNCTAWQNAWIWAKMWQYHIVLESRAVCVIFSAISIFYKHCQYYATLNKSAVSWTPPPLPPPWILVNPQNCIFRLRKNLLNLNLLDYWMSHPLHMMFFIYRFVLHRDITKWPNP